MRNRWCKLADLPNLYHIRHGDPSEGAGVPSTIGLLSGRGGSRNADEPPQTKNRAMQHIMPNPWHHHTPRRLDRQTIFVIERTQMLNNEVIYSSSLQFFLLPILLGMFQDGSWQTSSGPSTPKQDLPLRMFRDRDEVGLLSLLRRNGD